MSGVSIIVDDAEILAALGRLESASLQPALDAIGAHLVTTTQQRFEKETGPDGKKWQRLRPRTAARRIGKGQRGFENILRVSNRLVSTISHEVSADAVRVGTNVDHAAIHQLGGEIKKPARKQKIYQRYNEKTGVFSLFTTKGRANLEREVDVKAHTIRIPARPYLGVDEADRKAILDIISNRLATEVRP